MTDFSSYADSLTAPARSIRSVTPDDDNDLPDGVCKALFVTADGDLEVIAQDDSVSVTLSVSSGQIIPVRVKRVLESTSATVLAFY